ncbi:hypothetical protein FOA52_008851 [Chlamydomonas sp. UWO 241]|nr:hypothetical protein FOA52_008851 [Chlamydomonas sp. UWO 241]
MDWTNHSPSDVTARLRPEIERFGRLLKWVYRFEPLFIFVPIATLLRMLRFSPEFCEQMVFPLVALFFGTGNQTPHVASAVIARVFLDPDLRLFDFSPERLLDSVPEMFAFPVLQDVYTTIADKSHFTLHVNRPLARVVRGGGGGDGGGGEKVGTIVAEDAHGCAETFDEIVFACDAETVLKVLKQPSWLEKRLLSNITYFDDYCVTHDDSEYMTKMYDVRPAQLDNYFVRTYPQDPRKIEMSFNLSTYQPHLKEAGLDIYQTYYLDARDKPMWTDGAVAKGKVLATRWLRQFAHTWRHFAFFVPWGRFMQGTKHTWYAGAYTLFNTQEIAVMSGLAAAERLGAPYPFPGDKLAASQFDMFLGVAHGCSRRK